MKKPQIKNERKIVVNTGLVPVSIYNEEIGEKIGTIWFNPTDTGLITRYQEASERLRNLDIPDEEELTPETFARLNQEFRDLFDFLLNRSVSGELFKVCEPLARVNGGEYYFSVLLAAIIQLAGEVLDERNAESERRITEAVAELTANE